METNPHRRVILVAEDSVILRRVVEAELAREGYLVLSYPDADGALRHLALGERVDALVTDINMPGACDGLFLAEQARSGRPSLPVVYMSTMRPGDADMVEGALFVGKPFAVGAVTGAVRDTLSMPCHAAA